MQRPDAAQADQLAAHREQGHADGGHGRRAVFVACRRRAAAAAVLVSAGGHGGTAAGAVRQLRQVYQRHDVVLVPATAEFPVRHRHRHFAYRRRREDDGQIKN